MSWKPSPLYRRSCDDAYCSPRLPRHSGTRRVAVPPPSGSVTCLLPSVQQWLLLAQCSAVITPGNQPSWSVLRALFTNAPFRPKSGDNRTSTFYWFGPSPPTNTVQEIAGAQFMYNLCGRAPGKAGTGVLQ